TPSARCGHHSLLTGGFAARSHGTRDLRSLAARKTWTKKAARSLRSLAVQYLAPATAPQRPHTSPTDCAPHSLAPLVHSGAHPLTEQSSAKPALTTLVQTSHADSRSVLVITRTRARARATAPHSTRLTDRILLPGRIDPVWTFAYSKPPTTPNG